MAGSRSQSRIRQIEDQAKQEFDEATAAARHGMGPAEASTREAWGGSMMTKTAVSWECPACGQV